MAQKSIVKIFIIFLMTILLTNLMLNVYSIATDDGRFNMNFDYNGNSNAEEQIRKTARAILSALKIICIAIAIVMLIIISMRYMISSPADRVDIKKHAVPYVIGSVILFGTSGVLQIIQSIAKVFD